VYYLFGFWVAVSLAVLAVISIGDSPYAVSLGLSLFSIITAQATVAIAVCNRPTK